MATGQVAISRHRAPGPLQRPSRQAVPAFLQKLHEMVNDPNNADLIRWSDAGDSFFVLDHERFAREVLGRWFKHQNFASFVRQLNMYGFHKIPHLQQGVLRSDNDTEHWNFAHANFLRGQPDLLCLIQRKKQPTHPGDEMVMDLQNSITAAPAPPLQTSAGQLVDTNSILNGIAAIKRHQATISSELNDLKQSNQMLWQDAMDARQKHQKQQDTINRIVKFLAGVFGTRASPHKEDVVNSNSRAVVPHRKLRFMIEDGRSGKVTVEDEKDVSENGFDIENYPIIETPGSIPSPSPSDNDTPLTPYTPPQSAAPSSSTSQPQLPNTFQQSDIIDRSVTPTRSSGGIDMDRFQMILNHLTPSQIQQLLSTIPNLDQISSNDHSNNSISSQITQYTPPSDLFNQFINPISIPQSMPMDTAATDGLLSFEDNHELGLPDHTLGNVAKHWTATEDIERDVNAMNTDLETFIRGLGIDPQNIGTGSGDSSPSASSLHLEPDDVPIDPTPPPISTTNATPGEPSLSTSSSNAGDNIFDFDSFLNSFDTAGGPDASFSADETFDSLESATQAPPPLPLLPAQQHQQGAPIPGIRVIPTPSTKRKSDASELQLPLPISAIDGDGGTGPILQTSAPAKPTKRRRNK